jgi:hypothetical protein
VRCEGYRHQIVGYVKYFCLGFSILHEYAYAETQVNKLKHRTLNVATAIAIAIIIGMFSLR